LALATRKQFWIAIGNQPTVDFSSFSPRHMRHVTHIWRTDGAPTAQKRRITDASLTHERRRNGASLAHGLPPSEQARKERPGQANEPTHEKTKHTRRPQDSWVFFDMAAANELRRGVFRPPGRFPLVTPGL
jgi:hypothetical protein